MHDFKNVSPEYNYKVKLDPSLFINETWIDSYTTDFYNAQRDNIFVSSSKYDVVMLRTLKSQFYTNSDEKLKNAKKAIASRSKVRISSKNSNQKSRSKSAPTSAVKSFKSLKPLTNYPGN